MRKDATSAITDSKGLSTNGRSLDHEAAVLERYSSGARRREADLCCPVQYDSELLEVIPAAILERDYGCGDPSRYVQRGETVLDLGSGAGKICYILSQKVGPEGRVIGVDMNETMLELAESHRLALAEKIGWDNVEFRKGRIQDLRTDLRGAERWLAQRPVGDLEVLSEFEQFQRGQRETKPLVADSSVQVVVSNCVLNLIAPDQKTALFDEIFRVLARGGRAVISDIVSDEDVPESMRNDPQLWSGCISGALREDAFLEAFVRAGFYGVEILERSERPWRTVQGIEFRSVTVAAYRGKRGACLEKNQAVIYKGPFSVVEDDDGHRYPRGEPMAVCEKTFSILGKAPYADRMIFIEPREEVHDPQPFDCAKSARRHPRQTKGMDYDLTTEDPGACCGPNEDCC